MRQVKLKDITTKIGSGATPSGGKQSYKTTGIALIRSLNVFDLNFSYDELAYINDEQAKKLNNVTIEPDDILLNITGASVARCCILPKNLLPARVNQHVSIIRINKGLANPYFIQYLLVSPYYKQKLLSIAQGGATREALTKESIENFEIIIPKSKNTQDKIAKILSNYDDLIENNNKRIKILEEMAQKIYKEWFVDFKFPGHETATFKDSELGKIPNNWEIKQIGKEYKTYLGGTPSRNEEKYWNGKIPWLNSGKTNELRITKASEYVTELGLEKSSTKLMPQYTTVLAITGATLGQVSMLGSEMCANQSVVGIYSDKNPEYVFYLMKDKIQKLIQSASGGAQQHINKDIVNEMKFVLPADTMLNDFKDIIRPINKEIFNLLYKNHTLKQTRDLLLPRLISGEIDVENLEIL